MVTARKKHCIGYINSSNSKYLKRRMFKVYTNYAYQCRLKRATDWMTAHVAVTRGPPKYKQHAVRLSGPLCLDTLIPLSCSIGENLMIGDSVILVAIDLEPQNHSKGQSMPYPANYVQKSSPFSVIFS
ncbi:hypothetical protein TNCV_1952011 [Trichonephila clavipes]|nr:hypothetical protein TNCV_1952011 [Trichonephila clavipes]